MLGRNHKMLSISNKMFNKNNKIWVKITKCCKKNNKNNKFWVKTKFKVQQQPMLLGEINPVRRASILIPIHKINLFISGDHYRLQVMWLCFSSFLLNLKCRVILKHLIMLLVSVSVPEVWLLVTRQQSLHLFFPRYKSPKIPIKSKQTGLWKWAPVSNRVLFQNKSPELQTNKQTRPGAETDSWHDRARAAAIQRQRRSKNGNNFKPHKALGSRRHSTSRQREGRKKKSEFLFFCSGTSSPFHRERVLSSFVFSWCEREGGGRITHITEVETERVTAEGGGSSQTWRQSRRSKAWLAPPDYHNCTSQSDSSVTSTQVTGRWSGVYRATHSTKTLPGFWLTTLSWLANKSTLTSASFKHWELTHTVCV